MFLKIMSVLAAIILVLATVVAAYTGDWSFPGVVAGLMVFFVAVMLFFFLRALLIVVLFFWPFLIAIIVTWAGYRVLIERSKDAKTKTSSNGEQPERN